MIYCGNKYKALDKFQEVGLDEENYPLISNSTK